MRTLTSLLCASALVLGAAACSDDDDSSAAEETTSTTASDDDASTLIASGEDVELVGDDDLGGQTLNITAEEEDGEVTGEFRVADNAVAIECVDTDTEGVVMLGGAATDGPDVTEGDLLALVIREGDPDGVFLVANDAGAASCTELLDSISRDDLDEDGLFVPVEAGSDIETAA
jgi:hypothetical protein